MDFPNRSHRSSQCGEITALLIGIAVALGASEAFAVSNPNDFCTGDPCRITSKKVVDNLAVVDFGTRAVIVEAELDVGTGSATFRAGSFSIPNPGKLRGIGGTANNGGSFTIQTVNDIVIDSTVFQGAIRLNGRASGNLTLTSTAGAVRGGGTIFLENIVEEGAGGNLTISAATVVNLTGQISAPGGRLSSGGSLSIRAGTSVTITGLININGGGGGGGFLDISTPGAVTLGQVNADGGGDGGEGGGIDIAASAGPVNLTGRLSVSGGEANGFCGDGGTLDVFTGGDITLGHVVTLNGPVVDCCGGSLTLDGDAVRIANNVSITGLGEFGCGGILEGYATDTIVIDGAIDINGGDGGAGELLLSAEGDIDVNAPIDVRSRNVFGFGPAAVEIESFSGAIAIAANINASGGASAAGGSLFLTACEITMNSGKALRAEGDFGTIEVAARDLLALHGSMIAGPNNALIAIAYGTRADPPNLSGATFNITPVIALNTALPSCRLCDTNAECDDLNACTNDLCVPARGCQNTPNTAPCSDGNACTLGDACAGGTCGPGPLRDCSDTSPCTQDLCNPVSGACSHPATSSGAPCDDGNACTQPDTCNAVGSCVGSNPVVCPPAPGPCYEPSTCSPGTGTCSPSPPRASGTACSDGDGCTSTDRCDGSGTCAGTNPVVCTASDDCHDPGVCNTGTGACSDPAKSDGTGCDDDSVCTENDACSGGVCGGAPIAGCIDNDGDHIPDNQDACTTTNWTAFPRTPPDQHPQKFVLNLKKLDVPNGLQVFIAKGFFNPVAAAPLPIDPTTNGMHLRIEEEGGLPTSTGGVLFDLSIPGGALGSLPCDPGDGWKTIVRGKTQQWKYTNRSGALPPACLPGSARGITVVQVKDLRATRRQAYQFVVRGKNTGFDRLPETPLTLLRTSIALAAEPAPGTASAQAMAGQCGEALLQGAPVRGRLPPPYCKALTADGKLVTVSCKGL